MLDGTGATILVVDDEPALRMILRQELEDLGYSSSKPKTARRACASCSPISASTCTDVGLPGGMNGRQMAEVGRQERTDLRVLFVTGYAENAVIGNGYLEAGTKVLTKPFSREDLGRTIASLVGAAPNPCP